MDEYQLQLETAAYNEKIYLAKLEAQKAQERVAQLEYEYARFQMQACQMACKAAQEAAKQAQQQAMMASESVQ